MPWPSDHDALLTKLYGEGQSFSQVATALNEMFGTAYSRNAAIGRASRLGIAGGRRKETKSLDRVERSPAVAPKPAAAAPVPKSAPAPVEVEPPPGRRLLSLFELTDRTCKFPIGDPRDAGFGFCGSRVTLTDPPVPYCRFHCRIAYQPRDSRRRAA